MMLTCTYSGEGDQASHIWLSVTANVFLWRQVRRQPYQSNDSCSNPNERADRDDNQSQFPTLVKPQQESTDARGHALNENGHLVSNGIIDFINIPRNKVGFDH